MSRKIDVYLNIFSLWTLKGRNVKFNKLQGMTGLTGKHTHTPEKLNVKPRTLGLLWAAKHANFLGAQFGVYIYNHFGSASSCFSRGTAQLRTSCISNIVMTTAYSYRVNRTLDNFLNLADLE